MKRNLIIFVAFLAVIPSCYADDFTKTLEKAERGNAKAQNELAEKYLCGDGVALDYEQAAVWYAK